MHLKKNRDIQKERRQDRKKGQGGRKKKKYFPSSPLQIGYCSVSLALYTCHLSCYIGPAIFLLYARWLIHHLAGPRGTSCGIRQERRFSGFRVDLYYCIIFCFLFFWGCRFFDCFFCFYFLGHRFATVLCFAVADLSLFFFLSLYRRFLCPGHRLSLYSFPWLCSVSWSSLCCCFPFGGRQIFRLIIYIFPCYVVFVPFFYHFILLILILFRDRHFVSIFTFYCISFYLVFLE